MHAAVSTEMAYQHCLALARQHYENFPVASWFLEANKKRAIAAIYAFARMADDIADESKASTEERTFQLDAMSQALSALAAGDVPQYWLYVALDDAIKRYHLPVELLQDLLVAFKQDVTKSRYRTFEDILNYCRYSANPIGRLLLHLHDEAQESHLLWSDHICTALQLINFYQDLANDYDERNRIYIPLDEMERFGVSENDIRQKNNSFETNALMKFQIERAGQLLSDGKPLIPNLSGRFQFELKLIVSGGTAVLKKLKAANRNVFERPKLSRIDGIGLFIYTLFN